MLTGIKGHPSSYTVFILINARGINKNIPWDYRDDDRLIIFNDYIVYMIVGFIFKSGRLGGYWNIGVY